MTKDREVSKWYAERLGLDGDTEWLFDINDPACQLEIIEWLDYVHNSKTMTINKWTLEKGNTTTTGITFEDALIALWEAMK